jgi:hypothetical protein
MADVTTLWHLLLSTKNARRTRQFLSRKRLVLSSNSDFKLGIPPPTQTCSGATQLGVCALRSQAHVRSLPLVSGSFRFHSLFPKRPAPFAHWIRFRRSELALLFLSLSLRVSLRFDLLLVRIRVSAVKIAKFRSELVDFRHILRYFIRFHIRFVISG